MSKFEILSKMVFMLLLANIFIAKGQIPINDSGWQLQSEANGSEDFDGALDTTNRWHPRWPWQPNEKFTYSGSAEANSIYNLLSGVSTFQIMADSIDDPDDWIHVAPSNFAADSLDGVSYCYTGGVIWRKQIVVGSDTVDPYHFGYIEILAKFPTGYYPLWPAFWLFGGRSCDYAPPHYNNEIDIVENHPDIAFEGDMTSTNTHIDPDGCDDIDNYQEINTGFLLSSAFHKYACEWDPDRITWYIDDVAVRTYFDPSGATVPQNAMSVILNFALAADRAWLPGDWNNPLNPENPQPTNPTAWPDTLYFEIDYLNYYKLPIDECSTPLNNLCTPAGYNRKIKQYITTDATCTPIFNPSTAAGSYTLRAVDYVTLNAGTVINPTNTGYFAIHTLDCPD